MNMQFRYQKEETFCKLPNLKEIQDKAAEKLPPFLARKIEVRSVAVRAIRIIAETGDFNSLDELENVLTVDGADYLFSISAEEGGGVIIWLTPTPTLDLADLINNPDFDGCVENALRLVATLPESEIVFKAVLDLDISLYLRIL